MGKIAIGLFLFGCLALFNFAIAIYFDSEQKDNIVVIELVLEQKHLSQWLAMYSMQTTFGDNNQKDEFTKNLDTYSTYLLVLKNGGKLPKTFNSERILPAADDKSLAVILELEKHWKQMKMLGVKLIDGSSQKELFIKSVDFFQQEYEQLAAAETLLLEDLLQRMKERRASFFNTMILMLVGYAVFALVFYSLLKNKLKRPIDEIKQYATSLANGTLQVKRQYYSTDELGYVINDLELVKQNIAKATNFAIGIGNDKYEDELEAADDDQLSQALMLMREKITASASEDEKRRWIAEGLSEFSQLLRSDSKKNLKELANKIISELIKYVEANQGALFLLEIDGEEEYMEMVACYAFDRNKYFTKKIALGEGLVGQVWREADSVYLEEIPENFITIKSGLGDSLPRSIFILPLKTEDKVEGVLEIAFMNKMESHHKVFIEKLCENIASAFAAAKINQNTQQLLEVSQQQAEELRAQEEEMRQNMEELQATQEEMARQKKEMEVFNSAVDSSSVIVEFDSEGKFAHINQKFIEITGYSREDVIGKSHEFYVPKSKITSGSFQKLWEDLKEGNHFVRDVERLKKDGSPFWLRASYMPIFDEANKLVRISCICFDVTKEKLHEKEMNNFTHAVDNSSIIIDFNRAGKIIHINKKFKEVTGYTEEEIIGQPHSYYVPKDSIKSGAFETLWNDLSKGEYFVRDVERVKKNGEHFWLRASYMPIFDEDNNLAKISCICFDVTKEKLHEKEMNNFTDAVDNSSIIIDFNRAGKIIHINKKFKEVTGYTEEEMIGQAHSYYVPKDAIKSGAFEKLWEDLSQGKHFVRDVERVKKNGEHFWLRASYMPIFADNGQLAKISCICFDITEEKIGK
jgi:methyl-accepting chemotaxis protein